MDYIRRLNWIVTCRTTEVRFAAEVGILFYSMSPRPHRLWDPPILL